LKPREAKIKLFGLPLTERNLQKWNAAVALRLAHFHGILWKYGTLQPAKYEIFGM